MAVTVSKGLALLIAVGYIVAALVLAPPILALFVALACLAPVALTWFPEYFGGSWTKRKKTVLYTYDEPTTLERPLRDSHPSVVAFMGWFFLVALPPLIGWLGSR